MAATTSALSSSLSSTTTYSSHTTTLHEARPPILPSATSSISSFHSREPAVSAAVLAARALSQPGVASTEDALFTDGVRDIPSMKRLIDALNNLKLEGQNKIIELNAKKIELEKRREHLEKVQKELTRTSSRSNPVIALPPPSAPLPLAFSLRVQFYAEIVQELQGRVEKEAKRALSRVPTDLPPLEHVSHVLPPSQSTSSSSSTYSRKRGGDVLDAQDGTQREEYLRIKTEL